MADETDLFPMPAFFFKVDFAEIGEASFQEVSGLSSEIEVETVREGGENRFSHMLPKSVSHGKLVVKRGIFNRNSNLYAWCAGILGGGFANPIGPKRVVVSLLDEKGAPCMTWTLSNVYPVKWEISEFSSTKNDIAVESITFCYNSITQG